MIPEDVRDMFERLALQLAAAGWSNYSARAIMHRIRWHHHVEAGDRDFKCNNNWTPTLSREFMKKYPTLNGFFRIRSSPYA